MSTTQTNNDPPQPGKLCPKCGKGKTVYHPGFSKDGWTGGSYGAVDIPDQITCDNPAYNWCEEV